VSKPFSCFKFICLILPGLIFSIRCTISMSFEVITLIGPNCSRYKRKGPFRCQMAVSGAYDISYGDKVWEDQGSKSVKTGRGERVYAIEEKEMFLGSSIDSESSNLRQLREVFNSLR